MCLAKPITVLALGLVVGCSLSDNPRDFRGRRGYHTRRATLALLGSPGDRVSDWDGRLSNDLQDGAQWSLTLEGRTLGGALIRQFSVDDEEPVPYPVIADELEIEEPTVSPENVFLAYQTPLSDGSRRLQRRLWIGHLPPPPALADDGDDEPGPAPQTRRVAPSGVAAYELEAREPFKHFCWSASGALFAYYREGSRRLLVGEAYVDPGNAQVKVRILARLAPKRAYLDCVQAQWLSAGQRLLTLWRLPGGRVAAWRYERGRAELEPVAILGEDGQEQLDSTIVQFAACPRPEESSRLLVESRSLNALDEDRHRLAIHDLASGESTPLVGLPARTFAPRWWGRKGIIASRVKAGLPQKRGSRWEEWFVYAFSHDQARGRGRAAPRRLPVNLGGLDWNQNSAEIDRQLLWLAGGEVAAYVDPDTQRNIILSDIFGNRLALLKNRNRQTPPIVWIQVVSSRPDPEEPSTWRDHLYFLEGGIRGNLKRLDLSPLSDPRF